MRALRLSTLLTVLLTAATVRGQSTDPPSSAAIHEARRRFERGLRLYDAHDNEGALAEFLRAYELSHRASLLFNLTATYRNLHRYPEAVDALRRFLAEPHVTRRQRTTANRALAELESLLAHVRLDVTPSDATLLLDGHPAAPGDLTVGPGTHVVEATLPGFVPAREEIIVASGETRRMAMSLQPVPPPPSPPPASPPPPPSRLAFRGIPRGALVQVDGQFISPDAELSLSPGVHEVTITSPDRRTWRGPVLVEPGTRPTLDVRLAPRPGLRPVYLGVTAAGTVLLAAAATACGVLAIETHDAFLTHLQEDPEAQTLAARGRVLAIAADSLGVAAVAAGVVAVILLTRTEFTQATSRARIVFAPYVNGALVGGAVAF